MPTKPRPTRSPVSAKKTAKTRALSHPAKGRSAAKAAPRVAKKRAKPASPARRHPVAARAAKAAARVGKRVSAPARATALTSATSVAIPSGPSGHDLAVEAFEHGFRALQQRRFDEAARLFSSIFQAYPDEKELHERGRVYLAICDRQAAAGKKHEPQTLEERMNSATVALNRGAYEEAIKLLRGLEVEHDVVHYMLAVAHAALGDSAQAIPHLRHAVELNPENRFLALQDADLEPLRSHPGFSAVVQAANPSPRRPSTTRLRSSR